VVCGKLVLWFPLLALVYVAEAVSVMAQVSYFKLTKSCTPAGTGGSRAAPTGLALAWYKLTHRLPGEGKRLLRMAPLHHHFEALGAERGVREPQVVAAFWGVQLVICAAVVRLFL
jgi:UDP-N-acetylmuramyl pentapeptide phosphotransferase/UDP-N-acetylglucosamine-1-phosphate transferase